MGTCRQAGRSPAAGKGEGVLAEESLSRATCRQTRDSPVVGKEEGLLAGGLGALLQQRREKG